MESWSWMRGAGGMDRELGRVLAGGLCDGRYYLRASCSLDLFSFI